MSVFPVYTHTSSLLAVLPVIPIPAQPLTEKILGLFREAVKRGKLYDEEDNLLSKSKIAKYQSQFAQKNVTVYYDGNVRAANIVTSGSNFIWKMPEAGQSGKFCEGDYLTENIRTKAYAFEQQKTYKDYLANDNYPRFDSPSALYPKVLEVYRVEDEDELEHFKRVFDSIRDVLVLERPFKR